MNYTLFIFIPLYRNHCCNYLKYILVVEITFPIIRIILGALGKPEKQKIITITLNSLIFILFSSLRLLNLWIMTFGT
ncbi:MULTISPECIES: hypothetical protein [Bacillus cereus group]|uniref:hypothetical protein n=1 Tax=Bacillus wiedmannii TaxID=1890302 RepID=UPI0009711F5A